MVINILCNGVGNFQFLFCGGVLEKFWYRDRHPQVEGVGPEVLVAPLRET